MSNVGNSPWDKRKISDGPRLVDDQSASEIRYSSRQDAGLSRGSVLGMAPASPGRTGPTERRRIGRLFFTMVGVAAALVVVFFVAERFLGNDEFFDIETAALSVVMVVSLECNKAGSGSLVSEDGLVLTNSHVVTDDGQDVCFPMVGFTNSYDEEPSDWYQATILVNDPELDLAVLQILRDDGTAVRIKDRDPIPLDLSAPNLGDRIQTLGYPGVGGNTMTLTSGDFAGVDQLSGVDFYKTTASLNPGVSGGSAFNGSFELIGVPTAGTGVEVICEQNDCTSFGDSLGLIRPIRYAVPLIEAAKLLAR